MGKRICESEHPSEASIRASDNIKPEEKRMIWRALKWADPEFRRLHSCIENNLRHFYADPKRVCEPKATESICASCDCSSIESFCNALRSEPALTQEQLCYIIKVLEEAIYKEIKRRTGRDPRVPICRAEFYIVPVLLPPSDSESSGASTLYCDCYEEDYDDPTLTCHQLRDLKDRCFKRVDSIEFRHFGTYLNIPSSKSAVSIFILYDVGPSELVAKWGRFLNIVAYVLHQRDMLMMNCYDREGCLGSQCRIRRLSLPEKIEMTHECCATAFKNTLWDLDRFKNVEYFGFAIFCLNLVRWKHCVTKRWSCLMRQWHVIVHLPSMNYPVELRYRCENKFKCVQNIQIGRLGWLVNKNAQVLYVYPGVADFEFECYIRTLVRVARPDVDQSRLELLINDDEEDCYCKLGKQYRTGCERLFYTPKVFERLRNLAAGSQGFIIPGVLGEKDVFVGCELKTSVLGPCLEFQKRLLDKSYVMSLLANSDIRHPPFARVWNFTDVCKKMAELIVRLAREDCWCGRWLVKLNIGYYGNQTGLVTLECQDVCDLQDQDELIYYLSIVMTEKLVLNKKAYKRTEDFFEDLKHFGGLVQACPENEFSTVSLGCFIEHDLAKAVIRTSADVIRMATQHGCNCGDIGYVIPQTALPNSELQQLVVRMGEILIMEPFTGFFHIDLVAFYERDDNNEPKLNYWVVDVDPYYSDLVSFEDWRRFCLDIPISAKFSPNPTLLDCQLNPKKFKINDKKSESFMVCSGKLFIGGLERQTGNFLVELCERNKIAYSHQTKAGVMICPVDTEKRYFLVFALCRGRRLALKYFVKALKVLHAAAVKEDRSRRRTNDFKSYLLDLARQIERMEQLEEPLAPTGRDGLETLLDPVRRAATANLKTMHRLPHKMHAAAVAAGGR